MLKKNKESPWITFAFFFFTHNIPPASFQPTSTSPSHRLHFSHSFRVLQLPCSTRSRRRLITFSSCPRCAAFYPSRGLHRSGQKKTKSVPLMSQSLQESPFWQSTEATGEMSVFSISPLTVPFCEVQAANEHSRCCHSTKASYEKSSICDFGLSAWNPATLPAHHHPSVLGARVGAGWHGVSAAKRSWHQLNLSPKKEDGVSFE